MSLVIVDCDQNSPEWYEARKGIATASEFQTILATGRGGGESKGRMTYMRKLAGERITGAPMYRYSNDHMERGHEQEPEARDKYAFLNDVQPVRVGFMRNDLLQAGASPDSLVGDEGLLEIKTRLAHLQIELLEDDAVPSEHIAQLQGQLWISGRKWVDFVSYCPGLPTFTRRVPRDEVYIANLAKAVAKFNAELNMLVQRIAA